MCAVHREGRGRGAPDEREKKKDGKVGKRGKKGKQPVDGVDRGLGKLGD